MSEDVSDKDFEKNSSENKNDTDIGGYFLLAFIGLFFIPSLIIAFIYYSLFRKGKIRFHLIFIVSIVIDLFAVLFFNLFDCWNDFVFFIENISHAGELYPTLILPIIFTSLILGSFISWFLIRWSIHQMNANPQNLENEDSWMYHFTYRKTPLEIWKRKKLIEDLQNGSLHDEEKSPMGLYDEKGEETRPVFRYQYEAERHTFITGGTGSGKTVSLMNLVLNDIRAGKSLCLLDMKGGPEVAAKVSIWCKENNRDFYHVVNGNPKEYNIPYSSGQCFYDALKNGSSTSKADMVLGMREYDTASEVYKTYMQRISQTLFSMLDQVEDAGRQNMCPKIKWKEGGIYKVTSACDLKNFSDLVAACQGLKIEENASDLWEEISSSRKSDLKTTLEKLKGQMQILTASSYGPWLKLSDKHPQKNIDLYDLSIKEGSVVLFSIDSDSEKDFSRFIGSLIMSDLSIVSAKRRNEGIKTPYNLYIDEFQILNPESIKGLLEKARQSHISVTLALQSFEQVASAAAKGNEYLNSVIDTCSNFILHNGMAWDSAERIAKIVGKQKIKKYSFTKNHKGFFFSVNWRNKANQIVRTTEEVDWIVPPSSFMEVEAPTEKNGYKATAVIVNKNCNDPNFEKIPGAGAMARKIWVIPAQEVLRDYYSKDLPPIIETDPNFDSTIIDEINLNKTIIDSEEEDGGFTMTEIPDEDSETEDLVKENFSETENEKNKDYISQFIEDLDVENVVSTQKVMPKTGDDADSNKNSSTFNEKNSPTTSFNLFMEEYKEKNFNKNSSNKRKNGFNHSNTNSNSLKKSKTENNKQIEADVKKSSLTDDFQLPELEE